MQFCIVLSTDKDTQYMCVWALFLFCCCSNSFLHLTFPISKQRQSFHNSPEETICNIHLNFSQCALQIFAKARRKKVEKSVKAIEIIPLSTLNIKILYTFYEDDSMQNKFFSSFCCISLSFTHISETLLKL